MQFEYKVNNPIRKYYAQIEVKISNLDNMETFRIEEYLREFRNVGRVENLDELLQATGLLNSLEQYELRDGMYEIISLEQEGENFNVRVEYKRDGHYYFEALNRAESASTEKLRYLDTDAKHKSFVQFLIEMDYIEAAEKYLNILERNVVPSDATLYEIMDTITEWRRTDAAAN